MLLYFERRILCGLLLNQRCQVSGREGKYLRGHDQPLRWLLLLRGGSQVFHLKWHGDKLLSLEGAFVCIWRRRMMSESTHPYLGGRSVIYNQYSWKSRFFQGAGTCTLPLLPAVIHCLAGFLPVVSQRLSKFCS